MAFEQVGLDAVLRDAAFQSGLARYQQGVNQMESLTDKGASAMSRVWTVGSAAVTIGAAAVVAGIGGILAISKTGMDALISWNDEVNTLSDNLGTTGEQSSAWAVAFQHVGLSVEEGGAGLNIFIKALDTYRKQVAEGKGDTSEFGKTLKTLGVNAFDSAGKLRTFDDLMPDLLDAFQKLPPGVDKSALAMQLFGARGGTKFLDFLSQGSAGLDDAREKAKLYGLTLSTDLSNAVEDFTFALNDSSLGLRGFWVVIGKSVLPVATKFVNLVNTKLLPPLVRFAEFVAPKMASALDFLFTAFDGVIDMVKAFAYFMNTGHIFEDFGSDLADLFGEDKAWAVHLFFVAIAKGIRDAILVGESFVNVIKLLATGDFTGGIFGLSEDAPWIVALLMGRETVIKLFDAISKGDWGGAWMAISDGAAEIWPALEPTLADLGSKVIAQVSTWGNDIWDWIADTAIPALATEGGKLETGIVEFVKDHGPEAWGLATEWGGKIWDWLPVVIAQIPEKITPLADSLASWLGTNWDAVVAPALADWSTKFWGWLGDAINALPAEMVSLSNAFREWTESDAAERMFNDVGFAIGKGIMDAIGSFFASGEGAGSAIDVLIKMQRALEQAQVNLFMGFFNIGKNIGAKIGEGIAASDFSKSLYDALNHAADALFGKLHEIAAKIVKAIGDALLQFSIPLPALQIPDIKFPTSPIPTGGNGNSIAQTQMLPIALRVMIGDLEIKNAVVTWSSEAVESAFGDAIQLVGAA